MALIECTKCKKIVSNTNNFCPNCGHDLNAKNPKTKHPNDNDIKSKNDKLNIENKDLSKKIKDNEANSQIAVTQMSFDTIGDNNLKGEILNLDLLNMTPLDAINALYSLQKKAKS